MVDPDSVMDYFAVNVWVNNKWDWPGKNWSMWRTIDIDETNPYADGRYRLCFYDLDFGGCGGKDEVKSNPIRDDNYNTDKKGLLGQNLKAPKNPAIECFIYLMSNPDFRARFQERLLYLSDVTFEETHATETLDWFKASYAPLFEQFYTRYYGTSQGKERAEQTEYDYAGYNNLKDFVTQRKAGIEKINAYIDTFYSKGEASQ